LLIMLNFKELFGIFTARRSFDDFMSRHLSIKDGLITYAVVFLIVLILLSLELLVFRLFSGFFAGQELAGLLIDTIIIAVILVIVVPIILAISTICSYVWGAFHFLIASLYDKGHSVNHFNAYVFGVFSSVNLVGGLLNLIPVLGWIGSCITRIYGTLLLYKTVKRYFSLTSPQALIVVLLPLNLVMIGALIFSVIVSGILVGPIFL